MNNFGQLLKLMRIKRKYSQEQLALLANTTHQAISNYERGKTQPSIEIIMILAKILDFKFIINNGNVMLLDNRKGEINMCNVEINIDNEMLLEVNKYKGDSIYFNTLDNKVLGSIKDEANSLELILVVIGELSVYTPGEEDYTSYKDKEAVEYLRGLYEANGDKYVNDNIEFKYNNWWEVLIGDGESFYDGITVDLDIINTEETITSLLMETRKEILTRR